MMTKEQAEKAALEFAMEKFKEGLPVQRVEYSQCITVHFASHGERAFQFIDLVPGDACIVWDVEINKTMAGFCGLNLNGMPLFSADINNIMRNHYGCTYDNYRKLGFNVLQIEKDRCVDGE